MFFTVFSANPFFGLPLSFLPATRSSLFTPRLHFGHPARLALWIVGWDDASYPGSRNGVANGCQKD